MKLHVGLTHDILEWKLLLDQEKVSYRVVNKERAPVLDRATFPVILLTATTISKGLLIKYLKDGGIVIADQASKGLVENIKLKDRIIILNVDVKKTVGNQKSCKKRFIFRDECLVEEVARVQKSQARRELVNAIKSAFWMLGLPYVHIWYFPDGLDSVFTFRIDFDEYEEREFHQICSQIKPFTAAISTFICMRTYEKFEHELKYLSSLGVEIGSHGYIHHVYRSYEQNDWNLERAEKLLLRYAERVKGFCAPHGMWNQSLQRVLEDREYEYSSEFSLNYDDFPFFPISGARESSVLQIPVHPISEGVFVRDVGEKPSLITAYFEAVIDHKAKIKEPIFLYGHPTGALGRNPFIFRNIIEQISKRNRIAFINFNTFAQWWKLRHYAKTEIEYEQGILKGVSSRSDGRLRFEVQTSDEQSMILSLDTLQKGKSLNQTHVVSTSIEEDEPEPQCEIGESLLQNTVFRGLKTWVKNEIDWEIKTPLSMIQVLDIRSFIKYVMRICYSMSKIIKT